MKIQRVFFYFLLFVGINLHSQNVSLNFGTHNTTINTCNGYIFDDSQTGNYSANQDRWITICPAEASGSNQRISLTFEQFDLAQGDVMQIYQGTTISSPIMTTDDNSPYFTGNELLNRTIMPSLIINTQCLTIRLTTDGSNQSSGFKAKIECTSLCQHPHAAIDSVYHVVKSSGEIVEKHMTRGIDTIINQDGSTEILSFESIDLCNGDSVILNANPQFPENNNSYHQSPENCIYEWSFGDGESKTIEYNTFVGHKFEEINGYNLSLIVEDTSNGGCRSKNLATYRVRIAKNPINTLYPPMICSGQEGDFLIGFDDTDNIKLDSSIFVHNVSERYENTVFIPDGPNCRYLSQTGCYDAPVIFDQFPQGAIVESVDDIMSICINIEHTFLGDLGFQIICPNGQDAILKHNTHQGGANMGQPSSIDNGCEFDDNVQGIGWTYCFSNQYLNESRGVITGVGNTFIDSTNTINKTGYFQTPIQSSTSEVVDLYGFEELIGCPLNGEWRLRICDDWGADNGFVFWWDLELTQNRYNEINWDYSVSIDTIQITAPTFITQETNFQASMTPPIDSVGLFLIQANIVDEFGCQYDTTLHVNVSPSVYGDTITASITDSEVYTENGFNTSEPGFHTQNLQSVNGCDSIIVLNLIVYPTYNDTITAEICDNEVYTQYNFNTSEPGFHTQELQTNDGFDSIIVLNLTVHPTYNDTITAEICDNEVYTQYNFNTSEPGYHTQELQTINGCDSIVVLNLTVHPAYNDTITAEICDNEVYTQYNFNTSESGYHTQELQTINGCDSIVVLNLTVHPTYNDTITAEICDNEVYTQYNFNTSEPGLHTQNLQSIYGCDSIVVLNLTVLPTFSDTTVAEICSNDRYTINGFDENTTGLFYRNLQAINGCDSIIVLDLTANPVYSDTIFAEICEGGTYENFGFSASANGTYRQYLETVKGCDSTVVLKLTVHPVYNDDLTVDICEGEDYSYDGNTYNSQGTYQVNHQSIHGCDSVINLHLNVHPKYLQTLSETICAGDEYIDRDFHESEAGTYQVDYQTYKGCDSIIVLELSVAPTYTDTIRASVNSGTFYNENGFFENERGTYTQYLSSEYGCDSTVVLVLDYSDMKYPDIFSPNAINPQDESNNRFCIYPEDETVVMDELIIFNRQGAVMFHGREFGDCWDGKYKGQYVVQGVYKYAVIYHNVATPDKKQRKVGSIMVEY